MKITVGRIYRDKEDGSEFKVIKLMKTSKLYLEPYVKIIYYDRGYNLLPKQFTHTRAISVIKMCCEEIPRIKARLLYE